MRPAVFARRLLGFGLRWARGYLERGRFEAPPIPHLSIETTNVCNSDCVFCANSVMKRKKGPLRMERFKKAVDDFVAFGGTRMDFNVTIGDPLLDPYLLERAHYVRRYQQIAGLGFVTTLQWLHRIELRDFFEAGFTWLSISTALSGRETYCKFFGVDKYDQMLTNLLALIAENKRRSSPISIHIDIKPTDEPIQRVLDHPDFRKVSIESGQDLAKQVKSRGFFVDDWQGAVTLPTYLKLRPLYPRANFPCRMLYKGLTVYSNGNVGACQCRDFEASSELIVGNTEDSLQQLWNGPHLQALRQRWLEKNEIPAICQSCRYYMR
jgi:radical SAM protein with 4Fe4S-binding SPASM domain